MQKHVEKCRDMKGKYREIQRNVDMQRYPHQSVTVPRCFPGTGNFFWDQFFLVPVLVLFFRDQFFPVLIPVPPKKWKIPGNFPVPVPNFSGTDTGTFSIEQIFPIPVPVLFI